MSLNDRVARLEHRAAGDRGVLLIKVVGGPTPEGAELRYGGVHGVGDYERGPGETLEAFELRLRWLAESYRASHVVLRAFPSRTLPDVEWSPLDRGDDEEACR